MQSKPKLDIINMLLEDCIMAYPINSFIISIYQQYQKRGWLSKKQLQGLYDKSAKISGVLPGRLAALESIIKKMPTRDRSELPENTPMFEKDENVGNLINVILDKYPMHKRVLYLKARYDNDEVISPAEISELEKFKKLLIK
jgi:hypothetical protein